jgi:ATP-dependent DNA helicase RecG
MKIQTVIESLRQGENSTIEFKTSDVRPEIMAREMVAFANASGGAIFIGVDDDGKLTGLDNNKNYEE